MREARSLMLFLNCKCLRGSYLTSQEFFRVHLRLTFRGCEVRFLIYEIIALKCGYQYTRKRLGNRNSFPPRTKSSVPRAEVVKSLFDTPP